MTITATDHEILHRYAIGVMKRADHHAPHIEGALLGIMGGIIWRGHPGSIQIKQYDGELANVLWVMIDNQRYAFGYNHSARKIEIRDRTVTGRVLHSVDNNNTLAQIHHIFAAL